MQRRTLFRWMLAALASVPLSRIRVWAQATAFPDVHATTLQALGETVLPASIGLAKQKDTVAAFITWVREFREGADMDHGYGVTRLRTTPASPAPAYQRQLEGLERAARAGGSTFAALPLTARRPLVEAAIAAAGVKDLPGRPAGQHVAIDLMALYFRGPEANDLCYGAAIGRGRCRSLDGSERPPAPLSTAR